MTGWIVNVKLKEIGRKRWVQWLVSTILVSNRGGGKKCFLFKNVETDSEAQLAFYSKDRRTGGSFLTAKRPGREVDHSPTSSAKVNDWSCTYTPPICLCGVYRDKFIPALALMDWGKPQKTSVGVTRLGVEIWRRYLRSTKRIINQYSIMSGFASLTGALSWASV
jgi:hypothetical protein